MIKNNTSRLSLIALAALAPLASQAALVTLSVTGWNQDALMDTSSGTYNKAVTGTLDNGGGNIEGGVFNVPGTYALSNGTGGSTPTVFAGVTPGQTYTSATASAASFTFQSATANNSLLLTAGTSSTLTLTTPSALTTLALFGTSGNGSKSATVTLTFTDSTTSVYTLTSGTGILADWYNNGSQTAALVVGQSVSNRSEEAYTTIYHSVDSRISLYETDITLTAADKAKTLSSVKISNTGTGNGALGIYAISSDAAVPEASASALLGVCGVLALARRRRA